MAHNEPSCVGLFIFGINFVQRGYARHTLVDPVVDPVDHLAFLDSTRAYSYNRTKAAPSGAKFDIPCRWLVHPLWAISGSAKA